MGPQGFRITTRFALRSASTRKGGRTSSKLPEYRWDLPGRSDARSQIGFGDFYGQDVWQEVPGEFRQLRRLIVTQGDTEPASVEQQRLLGQRIPSMYDLRNLFQVNVEKGVICGRWSTCCTRKLGRDGRDEAEELLERQSGNRDKPRILEAFNEPIDNWLDFHVHDVHRPRRQVAADVVVRKLARSTGAHDEIHAHRRSAPHVRQRDRHRAHPRRTCQLMKQAGFSEDVRKVGGIDIPTIKHLNQWFSLSLDLHGSEVSSNAAS
jgi:benzoyl-CoA 2,3-dioxygenase component B